MAKEPKKSKAQKKLEKRGKAVKRAQDDVWKTGQTKKSPWWKKIIGG